MNKQHFRKLHHEKGLATLTIVILLLFVATLVTLYTANTTVREQQVSANQYRADQALSAANAGLDYALAYYFRYTGPDSVNLADGDFSRDGIIDILTVPTLSGDGQEVFAELTITDADGGTNAFNGPHTITAVGFSDDRSATRTIQVEVDAFGILPGGGFPGFPLIAKGLAGISGNFMLINRYANATIWTGAGTAEAGSASTYVRDIGLGPVDSLSHELLVAPPIRGGVTDVLNATYKQAGLNSDVIENDDNLLNLDGDQFFKNFMVEDKATVRQYAENIEQRFSCATEWENLASTTGVVWIADFIDDAYVPCDSWPPSGSVMTTLGANDYPITLIIEGNLETGGVGAFHKVPQVIGLTYIIGDWTNTGNSTFQGSVIVEGNVDNTGDPAIIYDDKLYDGSMGNPPGAITAINPGTWKDW